MEEYWHRCGGGKIYPATCWRSLPSPQNQTAPPIVYGEFDDEDKGVISPPFTVPSARRGAAVRLYREKPLYRRETNKHRGNPALPLPLLLCAWLIGRSGFGRKEPAMQIQPSLALCHQNVMVWGALENGDLVFSQRQPGIIDQSKIRLIWL